jgi:hypothetical protein
MKPNETATGGFSPRPALDTVPTASQRDQLNDNQVSPNSSVVQPTILKPTFRLNDSDCVAYIRSAQMGPWGPICGQTEMCHSLAVQAGLRLTTAYSDIGKCGMTIEGRSGLAQLMNDARDGQFGHIVTSDLDRFARSPSVAFRVIEELLNRGIAIHHRGYEGRLVSVRATGPADAQKAAHFALLFDHRKRSYSTPGSASQKTALIKHPLAKGRTER